MAKKEIVVMGEGGPLYRDRAYELAVKTFPCNCNKQDEVDERKHDSHCRAHDRWRVRGAIRERETEIEAAK